MKAPALDASDPQVQQFYALSHRLLKAYYQQLQRYTLAELLEKRAQTKATIRRLSNSKWPEHWNTFDRDEMTEQAEQDERDLVALQRARNRLNLLDKLIAAKQASEPMECVA